jgi:hypothetical protein
MKRGLRGKGLGSVVLRRVLMRAMVIDSGVVGVTLLVLGQERGSGGLVWIDREERAVQGQPRRST